MTQLLQTAIEEALKQPPEKQDSLAKLILETIHHEETELRPIGLAKGQVEVPDSFFDPLPDDELARWNAEGPEDET